MRDSSNKGYVFRLVWVLDLFSGSSKTYINLVFQNIRTNYILVDSIPPELLSYCTVGTYFRNGKKLPRKPDGSSVNFTIESTEQNTFTEAEALFTDQDYPLHLNKYFQTYSNVCRKQLCFSQQVGATKIIIPCFVIASTYYFKSTSLREAILARRVRALSRSCTLDQVKGHAEIHLTSRANQKDAQDIARFLLDPFSFDRLNVCANHHYATSKNSYSRILVDLPVQQAIPVTARGVYGKDDDGRQAFIVFQIEKEGSLYPFSSLEVLYPSQEKIETGTGRRTFPASQVEHSGKMTRQAPSSGLLRHLLANSSIAENNNLNTIEIIHTPTPNEPETEQPTPEPLTSIAQADLSAQSCEPSDAMVAQGHIQNQDEEDQEKFEFSIDLFVEMITALRDQPHYVNVNGEKIVAEIQNFSVVRSVAPLKHEGRDKLSLKESYDKTAASRRQCAYISFTSRKWHVCIVEIDQAGIGNARCSTRVLISGHKISVHSAEICVRDYVFGLSLETQKEELKQSSIRLFCQNHPKENAEKAKEKWRLGLLKKLHTATPVRPIN
ncbi:hypothetical protein SAMN02745165_01731 [Malonomonas rubra DSM 5091]|uniref:TnsE C-terminal domain-containing protein n=2 Tax=Malonomonas rubra TaxID=57040 RepID=A0A1M6H8H7_MALRU|nr:hypothetical protein SAMN02745165_01731 [Malonomonas rubra DSM 5091]